MHPSILQVMGVVGNVYVFEIKTKYLKLPDSYQSADISKFPEVRRDLAILVNQTIPSVLIQDTIKETVGAWLKEVFIFDVYQGKGVVPGLKSVALAIILQHPTRTLIDEEVASMLQKVMAALKGALGAQLRS